MVGAGFEILIKHRPTGTVLNVGENVTLKAALPPAPSLVMTAPPSQKLLRVMKNIE